MACSQLRPVAAAAVVAVAVMVVLEGEPPKDKVTK
jgi:hypothetical protein